MRRSAWYRFALTVSAAALAAQGCGGGGGGGGPVDAGQDSGVGDVHTDTLAVCGSDAECDDGAYCNGLERCDPSDPLADARGCASGSPPCTAEETCDEDSRNCLDACDLEGDADGDGHRSVACGGDDCDDSDALRYPGAAEVCDTSNRDEDCDPSTFGFRDVDMDTYPDARCCNLDADGATMNCGNDCDDAQPAVHPTAVEACDELDNDCDGMVDEGVTHTYWPDGDGDGYGDPSGATADACFRPMGMADNMDDCDDSDETVHPGLPEDCTRTGDQNCNMMSDAAECTCTGTETRPCSAPGACAAGTEQCTSGTWSECTVAPTSEICNGIDDDCDGSTDEGLTVVCYADGDNDGYAPSGATSSAQCPADRPAVGGCPVGFTNRRPAGADIDCNDDNSAVRPGATEVCVPGVAPVDENCNGMIDEGVSEVCYPDNDSDTFPPMAATSSSQCTDASRPAYGFCPAGYTATAPGTGTTDCDDSTSLASPAGTEVCDGIDNDCNATVDDGVSTICYVDGDRDGYAAAGAASSMVCGACPSGSTALAPMGADIDCDDSDVNTNPGVLLDPCNGVDNDCSSGGGADPREDADGDHHTRIGFTGCSGGYPADDCDDNNADVHPGQTSYFTSPRCMPCTCGAAPYQRNGCYTGPLMCDCSDQVGYWDYDCDGAITHQYGLYSSTSCAAFAGCLGTGFESSPPPICSGWDYLKRCSSAGGLSCTTRRTYTQQGCR